MRNFVALDFHQNHCQQVGDAAKNLDCLCHEAQASSVLKRAARAQGHFDPLLVVPAEVRVQGLGELLNGR